MRRVLATARTTAGSPQAFVTATRQTVAEDNQWSLQELKMVVGIGGGGDLDAATFVITGTLNTFVLPFFAPPSPFPPSPAAPPPPS